MDTVPYGNFVALATLSKRRFYAAIGGWNMATDYWVVADEDQRLDGRSHHSMYYDQSIGLAGRPATSC
jgi:hypothetical protein